MNLNSEGDSLLAAIREHPEDDTPRLVFADWLQEQSRPERCRYCDGRGKWPAKVKWATESISSGFDTFVHCENCDATGWTRDAYAKEAGFIRLQCEIAKANLEFVDDLERKSNALTPKGPAASNWINHVRETWRRGFIERVECRYEDWVNDHEAILADRNVVLREVVLNTRPEVRSDGRDSPQRRWWFIDWQTNRGEERQTSVYADAYVDAWGIEGAVVRKWLKELSREYPGHCPNNPIKFSEPEPLGPTDDTPF